MGIMLKEGALPKEAAVKEVMTTAWLDERRKAQRANDFEKAVKRLEG